MNKDKLLITVGTVAVLAVAGGAGFYLFGRSDDNQATRQTATSQSSDSAGTSGGSDATPQGSEASGSYKDGTYKQSIDYRVPNGGTNTLTATVTVKDGTVTAVESTTDYEDRESVRYIDSFESGISGKVVGQSLDGLSISRIGSSSLTASAFNDVLDAVRSDAQT